MRPEISDRDIHITPDRMLEIAGAELLMEKITIRMLRKTIADLTKQNEHLQAAIKKLSQEPTSQKKGLQPEVRGGTLPKKE